MGRFFAHLNKNIYNIGVIDLFLGACFCSASSMFSCCCFSWFSWCSSAASPVLPPVLPLFYAALSSLPLSFLLQWSFQRWNPCFADVWWFPHHPSAQRAVTDVPVFSAGVARQREANGRVWHETSHGLPAYRTSGGCVRTFLSFCCCCWASRTRKVLDLKKILHVVPSFIRHVKEWDQGQLRQWPDTFWCFAAVSSHKSNAMQECWVPNKCCKKWRTCELNCFTDKSSN